MEELSLEGLKQEDIVSDINAIVQNTRLLSVGPGIPISDQSGRFFREPDAHMVLSLEENDFIIAVLESLYLETASTSLDDFQRELEYYFEIHSQINLVIGAYIPFRQSLSMNLIVLHRDHSIAPQVISFEKDTFFTIHIPTLFSNAAPVPEILLQYLNVDFKSYYPRIRNALREDWKIRYKLVEDKND
jgi:hypothetical protein